MATTASSRKTNCLGPGRQRSRKRRRGLCGSRQPGGYRDVWRNAGQNVDLRLRGHGRDVVMSPRSERPCMRFAQVPIRRIAVAKEKRGNTMLLFAIESWRALHSDDHRPASSRSAPTTADTASPSSAGGVATELIATDGGWNAGARLGFARRANRFPIGRKGPPKGGPFVYLSLLGPEEPPLEVFDRLLQGVDHPGNPVGTISTLPSLAILSSSPAGPRLSRRSGPR